MYSCFTLSILRFSHLSLCSAKQIGLGSSSSHWNPGYGLSGGASRFTPCCCFRRGAYILFKTISSINQTTSSKAKTGGCLNSDTLYGTPLVNFAGPASQSVGRERPFPSPEISIRLGDSLGHYIPPVPSPDRPPPPPRKSKVNLSAWHYTKSTPRRVSCSGVRKVGSRARRHPGCDLALVK